MSALTEFKAAIQAGTVVEVTNHYVPEGHPLAPGVRWHPHSPDRAGLWGLPCAERRSARQEVGRELCAGCSGTRTTQGKIKRVRRRGE